MFDDSTHKKCSKCKEVKLRDEFYKNNAKKYGLSSECKECAKKKARLYNKNNKEKTKEYRERNKEKIRRNWKLWYEKNRKKPEKIKKTYTELDEKYCAQCDNYKLRSEFYNVKKNIDNKDYTCKECKKKQKRRYLNENRDKVNDRRRKYHRDITKTNQIMRIIKVVK